MAEFSEGLLAGFQFVDNLRARGQNQELQTARVGLARAADRRAEQLFVSQQRAEGRAIARQRDVDRSSQLLAQAQTVGISNLQPHELVELQEAAAFNPDITAALQEHQEGVRDVQAIAGLRGVAAQSAPQVTAQPSGQVTQPQGDGVTPFDVTAPDGEGLPPADTLVTRPTFMIERMLGTDVPEELVEVSANPAGGIVRTVDLPVDFMERLSAAQDMPTLQQQAEMDKLREEMTGLPQQVAFNRMSAAEAELNMDAWRAAVDPDNRGGDALRQLANSSPSVITNKLHREWNTIESEDPNLTSSLAREMFPAVQQTLANSTAFLRTLPVVDGKVDTSAPGVQQAQRDFNNAIELQQQMSDTWSGELEARIRAGAMPVGNAELSAELAAVIGQTPAPGQIAPTSQRRANMTMAQRAVRSIADGGSRTLTTRQVQSLAWLSKRGYITPGGFERFLSTGTFDDPADAEFVDHDPDKILWRVAPNGEREIVWMPPTLTGQTAAADQFDGGQLDFIRENVFVDPSGTDEGNAYMKRQMNEFLITLHQNPDTLGLIGWSSEDVSQLTPQQVALLGERYKALKQTESDYENSFWARWVPFTTAKFEDLVDEEGRPLGFSNFDEIARERDIDVPPLPEPRADTRGARLELATSDDPYDRYLAIILSEQELQNAVLEAKAAQTNP